MGSGLGSGSGGSCCAWQRWRGGSLGTLGFFAGKLLFLKHGSQKSTTQPFPDREALILPGGAQSSPRAPSVSLSVCLCVGCVSCPWARSCSWLPPAVAAAVCTCAWNPVLTSGVGRGGRGASGRPVPPTSPPTLQGCGEKMLPCRLPPLPQPPAPGEMLSQGSPGKSGGHGEGVEVARDRSLSRDGSTAPSLAGAGGRDAPAGVTSAGGTAPAAGSRGAGSDPPLPGAGWLL